MEMEREHETQDCTELNTGKADGIEQSAKTAQLQLPYRKKRRRPQVGPKYQKKGK